jgi:endonuclease/exonuclease/phosphatase family metal-dependent hydrolase
MTAVNYLLQIIIFDQKSDKMKISVAFLTITLSFLMPGCFNLKSKEAIKVMTMNVRYDNPADSINAWSNRIPLFCKFISKEKPDILGMQEVLWNQYQLMDSVLKGYSSVGVGREDGARGGEMNPVFFRKDKFDLVRTITFWLSDTPELPGSKGWGASLPRIVTWLELVDKNRHEHFLFFNTHFAHDSDSARIMSSRILLKEVKKVADGLPFIVTGDFNLLPYSTAYSILTGPDESVPILKDSYFVSEKKPAGPTYTFNGFSDKPGNVRVDYIFVKNGLRVFNHSTLNVKDNEIFISDHWPVTAQISFK